MPEGVKGSSEGRGCCVRNFSYKEKLVLTSLVCAAIAIAGIVTAHVLRAKGSWRLLSPIEAKKNLIAMHVAFLVTPSLPVIYFAIRVVRTKPEARNTSHEKTAETSTAESPPSEKPERKEESKAERAGMNRQAEGATTKSDAEGAGKKRQTASANLFDDYSDDEDDTFVPPFDWREVVFPVPPAKPEPPPEKEIENLDAGPQLMNVSDHRHTGTVIRHIDIGSFPRISGLNAWENHGLHELIRSSGNSREEVDANLMKNINAWKTSEDSKEALAAEHLERIVKKAGWNPNATGQEAVRWKEEQWRATHIQDKQGVWRKKTKSKAEEN